MTSTRENNSLIRIKLAEWTRTFRREKFMMRHLITQGISIRTVMCPAMLANGTMCILKRFKKIAGGGVGLVWGCGRCRVGPSIIEEFFFFQAEDGIRDWSVTGVQTCALPI